MGNYWLPEIVTHCGNVPFILVGTRIDDRDNSEIIEKLRKENQRPITYEEGVAKANAIHALKYVECSVRTFEGVNDVFSEAARAVVEREKKEKAGRCTIA